MQEVHAGQVEQQGEQQLVFGNSAARHASDTTTCLVLLTVHHYQSHREVRAIHNRRLTTHRI